MDWSTWVNAATWPPKPHGYTWLMDAVEQISQAVIGDDWVGNEFGFEQHHMALNPTDPAQRWLQPQYYSAVWFWIGGRRPLHDELVPTLEQWTAAYERWKWCFENADGIFERKQLACVLIQKAAERGDLQFAARNETTGDMVSIPRARWNCDTNTALARLSRGRINLVEPMEPEPVEWADRQQWLARMTSWLFVPCDNLELFLRSVATPPAVTLVKARARAEDDAERWLREQFALSSTQSTPKASFQTDAAQQFAGLTGNAFLRAWAKAAKDFPERASAGAKPNRTA